MTNHKIDPSRLGEGWFSHKAEFLKEVSKHYQRLAEFESILEQLKKLALERAMRLINAVSRIPCRIPLAQVGILNLAGNMSQVIWQSSVWQSECAPHLFAQEEII